MTELTITYLGLFLFSWGYNTLVAWLERKGYHDGYVSLMVVGGVTYTVLTATWLIGIEASLILGGAFVSSGAPMIIGSIARHITQRDREECQMRSHARKLNDER